MTSTLHDALHSYDSIDELLGDGRHRFFSHGYKNTNPMLRELRISHTPAESQLTARAGLALSGGWSTKGTSQQTPHLGTTDVMVLGARMSEAMLASRHSPGLLPGAYVQSVTVSGGQTPVEGSLEDLECSASLTPDAGGQGSTVRCRVVSMAAEVRVAHADAGLCLASIASPSEEALVGPGSSRLYGDLWSRRQVTLESVRLSPLESVASARLSFVEEQVQGVRQGMESAHVGEPSPLEYFVASLQLGQVLLYELDRVTRASSSTLWMRKTRITITPRPLTGLPPRFEAVLNVRLKNPRIVEKAGEKWRCADVVGSTPQAEVVCSVAHRIP